jgi:hypothetical protein
MPTVITNYIGVPQDCMLGLTSAARDAIVFNTLINKIMVTFQINEQIQFTVLNVCNLFNRIS